MMRPMSARLTSGAARLGLALALALAFGWTPASIAAQATGTLVGTVRDAASQRPLEAVQVYIGGTGVGALTNSAGRFMLLNVPAGRCAGGGAVGYTTGTQTVTVAAGQSAEANFALEPSAIALDEVVVTGAGAPGEEEARQHRRHHRRLAALEDKPIPNVSQVLAGREPGVDHLAGGGPPARARGSASAARASLTQSNEPIIYVDGVRVDNSRASVGSGQGGPSRLDDINPESIERIEILKGAAAATLYGTEASNGVIQIFTKRGCAGAPRWVQGRRAAPSRSRPAGSSRMPASCATQADGGPHRRLLGPGVRPRTSPSR